MISLIIEIILIVVAFTALEFILDKFLPGKAKPEGDNIVLRFLVSVVCVVIIVVLFLLTMLVGFAGAFGDVLSGFLDGNITDSHILEIAGILTSIVYAGITFAVPYLSYKKTVTRNLGVLAIADIFWWLYIIIC